MTNMVGISRAMLARLGIVAGSARYEGIGDTTLEALHKRGLVSREPIEGRRLSERWAITDAGREVAAKALSGATVTARLSLTQRAMLAKVAKGYAHWRDADDTRPYQISNTNRTAGALDMLVDHYPDRRYSPPASLDDPA